jgi:hypothetical protein
MNKNDRAKLLTIVNRINVVTLSLTRLRNGQIIGMTNRDAIEQCELTLIAATVDLERMIYKTHNARTGVSA